MLLFYDVGMINMKISYFELFGFIFVFPLSVQDEGYSRNTSCTLHL